MPCPRARGPPCSVHLESLMPPRSSPSIGRLWPSAWDAWGPSSSSRFCRGSMSCSVDSNLALLSGREVACPALPRRTSASPESPDRRPRPIPGVTGAPRRRSGTTACDWSWRGTTRTRVSPFPAASPTRRRRPRGEAGEPGPREEPARSATLSGPRRCRASTAASGARGASTPRTPLQTCAAMSVPRTQ